MFIRALTPPKTLVMLRMTNDTAQMQVDVAVLCLIGINISFSSTQPSL